MLVLVCKFAAACTHFKGRLTGDKLLARQPSQCYGFLHSPVMLQLLALACDVAAACFLSAPLRCLHVSAVTLVCSYTCLKIWCCLHSPVVLLLLASIAADCPCLWR